MGCAPMASMGMNVSTEATCPAIPTISSLAILKVNFDQQGQDFIDNFVPFSMRLINVKGPGFICRT
jgi:hypothetical protein